MEERLLEDRDRVLRALAKFDERFEESTQDEAGDLSLYPLHMADEGTDTMEAEKETLLASKEGQLLYAIDDALQKLYKEPEKFGECENCGRAIDMDRLELVPHAKYCARCQRELEVEEV